MTFAEIVGRRTRTTMHARTLEHDPEKWKPVFGQDHAQR
jgi:hypothetical protein